jgi:hypothetical protein
VLVATTSDRGLAAAARIVRVPTPQTPAGTPSVTATWLGADGTGISGVLVTA